jgi:hypothetical protein
MSGTGTGDFYTIGMSVVGLASVKGRFQGAARRLYERNVEIVASEAEQIADLARGRIAELFRNPSRMQAAINVTSFEDVGSSATVSATVSAGGLPYMAIHEYGGVVMTPDIFPVNALALHWMAPAAAQFRPGGEAATEGVFAMHTAAHVTPIPERSYLRYALAQRREAIREAFAGAASFAVSGAA